MSELLKSTTQQHWAIIYLIILSICTFVEWRRLHKLGWYKRINRALFQGVYVTVCIPILCLVVVVIGIVLLAVIKTAFGF